MTEKTVELRIPLIFIRTKRGLGFIERLSRIKVIRSLNWLWVLVVPLLMIGGLYLIIYQIFGFFSDSVLLEQVKKAGVQSSLLIPGLNPFLPIFSGWIAIIIAIAVHELSHGVAARSVGVGVRSMGLMLFLGFPIGAFCEIDELSLIEKGFKDQIKVSSAGIVSNFVVALLAIPGLLLNRAFLGANEAVFSLFFVIILVNLSLAIFNALPIGSLDGGRIFNTFALILVLVLDHVIHNGKSDIVNVYRTKDIITGVASLVTIFLVVSLIAIPFIIL
ncbi:MAG: site-2 protease family protein [Candidatus Nealsonbacteria bacterium]|nr:site-2 protease family protein [Candidatus Nealsonbacteria bacterium]